MSNITIEQNHRSISKKVTSLARDYNVYVIIVQRRPKMTFPSAGAAGLTTGKIQQSNRIEIKYTLLYNSV